MPANRVGSQKMAKEPSNVAKLVGLVSMNRGVVLGEGLLE